MRKERDYSVVYFIQAADGGPIKIGVSSSVRERLSLLQVGSPVELQVLGSVQGGYDLEQKLHADLAEHHIRGEWFRPAPAVLAAMREVGAIGERDTIETRLVSEYIPECSNCGYGMTWLDTGGMCKPCREFAALRASGKDPFEGLDDDQ